MKPRADSTLPEATLLSEISKICDYDVTRLAESLQVSPRHLRRLFMRQLRCSPDCWLREERLQASLRLLPSASSVKEVAYALAFRHVSQFCRDFRARFGFTPMTYRELQRTGFGNHGRARTHEPSNLDPRS